MEKFRILKGENMRVGIGYDVHRLVAGRTLVLAGVSIPFDKGLEGHSDADVLAHAVCDAILGAAADGDIGIHFPDTDPQYENADSLDLLGQVAERISKNGYAVVNLDATLMAEAPKLQPYRGEMVLNLARVLDISPDCVSIKATTTEGLGFVGRGEGIAAVCVALIATKSTD
jgi:2-C-methyl-D-erythritol 2,4-cyclodiphosphate synthase